MFHFLLICQLPRQTMCDVQFWECDYFLGSRVKTALENTSMRPKPFKTYSAALIQLRLKVAAHANTSYMSVCGVRGFLLTEFSVSVCLDVFISGRWLFGSCSRVSGGAWLPRLDEICIGPRLSWLTLLGCVCCLCRGLTRISLHGTI